MEIVNLDLEGALEAVLEEIQFLTEEDIDEIWEEICCLDLDDPFPILDPVWIEGPLFISRQGEL